MRFHQTPAGDGSGGREATAGVFVDRLIFRRINRANDLLGGWRPGSVARVRQTYRQRFGIESSYRQLNQAWVRTSSRSPQLRLLFVGLAWVLRNVYVWPHWEVLAHKRRGKRRVDLNQLPLRAMLHWLLRVVEALLGVKESMPSERPFLE